MTSVRRESAVAAGLLVLVMIVLAITMVTAQDRDTTPEGRSDHAMVTPGVTGSTGTGVIYLTVTNGGDRDDILMEASTDRAERIDIHETVVENEVGRMVPQNGPLTVQAGETVTFEPGGLHLMLVNLTDDIRLGDTFEVTLTFEHAGEVTVPVTAVLDPEGSVSEPVTAGELTIEEIWSRPAPRIDGTSGTPVGTPHADDEHQH